MSQPKTCSHYKLDGKLCRMLAQSGKRYCYYHDRYSDRNTVPKNKNTYALVPFEDTRSILFTINQLIYSFLNDMIDESKFTKTIYALQVAAQYVNREDALSPDAQLEQTELEQAEQKQAEREAAEKAVAKTKSKPAEAADFDPKTDPACQLIQLLVDTIQELPQSEEEKPEKPRVPLPFEKT